MGRATCRLPSHAYSPLLAAAEVKVNKDFYYSFYPKPSHTSFMPLQQKVSLLKHDLKCEPVKREEQTHRDPGCLKYTHL